MAKKIVIANWKMNPQTLKEAENLFLSISKVANKVKNVEVVICSPFVFLSNLKKKNSKKIVLGAQNLYSEDEGAYTGEISAKMLKEVGTKYAILGHSERRALGEKNDFINKKVLLALKNKLIPILCIGENHRDNNGEYLSFIKKQVNECFKNIPKIQIKNIIVAYEPLWAIGKNAIREATPEEFLEISIFIKKTISDIYDPKTALSIKVIYGGSVHPENTEAFIKQGNADGFLVGRDSLNLKKFGEIIMNAGKK